MVKNYNRQFDRAREATIKETRENDFKPHW